MEFAEFKTLSCWPSRYNMAPPPSLPGNTVHVRTVDSKQEKAECFGVGEVIGQRERGPELGQMQGSKV